LAVLRPPEHDAERADAGRVTLGSLADDQLILVPDQCGLTSFTTRLFADSGNTLLRYPGEATSYRVLEEWSRLGLGTALLPVSKLTDSTRLAPELQHRDHPVLISYEAVWRKGPAPMPSSHVLLTRSPAPASDRVETARAQLRIAAAVASLITSRSEPSIAWKPW
jgi:hypothetical protein